LVKPAMSPADSKVGNANTLALFGCLSVLGKAFTVFGGMLGQFRLNQKRTRFLAC